MSDYTLVIFYMCMAILTVLIAGMVCGSSTEGSKEDKFFALLLGAVWPVALLCIIILGTMTCTWKVYLFGDFLGKYFIKLRDDDPNESNLGAPK